MSDYTTRTIQTTLAGVFLLLTDYDTKKKGLYFFGPNAFITAEPIDRLSGCHLKTATGFACHVLDEAEHIMGLLSKGQQE